MRPCNVHKFNRFVLLYLQLILIFFYIILQLITFNKSNMLRKWDGFVKIKFRSLYKKVIFTLTDTRFYF